MRVISSWFGMLLLAIVIAIVGIEGAVGKVLAVTFCPDNVIVS